MEPILEVKGLRKTFPGFALQDISFSLPRGFIMGLIGPNGSGKSTTIKLIMKLLKKEAGEIKICGLDADRHALAVKQKIGFVYDESYFYGELTAVEMKKIIAPFYQEWDEAAFKYYADRFRLPTSKKIKELSKGTKMKLALAVALSHHPELIIMDEPTSGLDPVMRSELLDVLRELLQDEGKGVLFSTHIVTDLDRVADYITMINNGKLVFSADKDALLETFGLAKGGRGLLTPELREKLVGLRESSFGFEGLTTDKAGVAKLLGDQGVMEKPSLEEIMVYLVRGQVDAYISV
ncbi:MAG TPA: ABC transporter ATP-binding protein [Clostridia bacterium]|nr:ABC transporter ATP-binding protein [Clostridia bacterium]